MRKGYSSCVGSSAASYGIFAAIGKKALFESEMEIANLERAAGQV